MLYFSTIASWWELNHWTSVPFYCFVIGHGVRQILLQAYLICFQNTVDGEVSILVVSRAWKLWSKIVKLLSNSKLWRFSSVILREVVIVNSGLSPLFEKASCVAISMLSVLFLREKKYLRSINDLNFLNMESMVYKSCNTNFEFSMF